MSAPYKPARPPPGTPVARHSIAASPSPFEMEGLMPLTPAGMESSDPVASVQSTILKSKLNSAQTELTRVKKELKAANEKGLQMSLKLNEEKVAKISLTNKYSAVVQRVKDFDERMRDAEEVMKQERAHHKDTQKSADGLRDQLRQKTSTIEKHEATMRRMSKERDDEAAGYRETMERTSDTAEHFRERQAQFMDYFSQLVTTSMDRLTDDRDSNDAAITVATSELASTITEQQQLLQKVSLENETMRDSLHFLVKEIEDESNALVITLLKENKEVWSQFNSCKAELARHRDGERSRSQKLTEQRLHEQLDGLLQENKKLEARALKANEALKAHTEKGKEHERTLQHIMDSLRNVEQEKVVLESTVHEMRATNATLSDKISTLESDVVLERRKSVSATSMQSEVATLKKRADEARESHKKEINLLRMEHEKDRAKFVEEIKQHNKQQHEIVMENERLQREWKRVDDHTASLQRQWEEEKVGALAQLKEELVLSKQMYERELEEVRRDLESSAAEVNSLQRICDKERVESTSMRMEFGSLTKSVVDLKAENAAMHDESKRLMEKYQDRQRDLESRRVQVEELEGQVKEYSQERERAASMSRDEQRSLEDDVKRLKTQVVSVSRTLEESESRVLVLERENHNLVILSSRDGRRSKEELEKDKDMLSNENQRILKQYEEVNEQNSRLLGELSRLRDKVSGMQVLQDRIDMYKRQLDAMEHQADELQEAREAVSHAEGENEELRREKDAMQARLEGMLDETSVLQKKELELDQCVEAADMQIKRLEQQMERASKYTASIPRSSISQPLGGSMSPPFDVTPNQY